MKENGRAVILNLLKHKWEPGLMYSFSSFLFQCKGLDLSMAPSLKYIHANVGIFTHFLPLGCFKAIEFRFLFDPSPLRAYILYGWSLWKIPLSPSFYLP